MHLSKACEVFHSTEHCILALLYVDDLYVTVFLSSLLRLVVGGFADAVQLAVLLVILCGRGELLLLLMLR